VHSGPGHQAHGCANSVAVRPLRRLHAAQADHRIVPPAAEEDGHLGDHGPEGRTDAKSGARVEQKGSQEAFRLAQVQQVLPGVHN